MAFRTKFQDKQNQDLGIDKSAPLPVAAGVGSVTPGAPVTGVSKGRSSHTNFTNLTDYLTANQQQAGQLGDKTAGYINNQISDQQNTLGLQAGKFSSNVNAQKTNYDQGAIDKTLASPDTPDAGVVTNLTGAYNGPNSFVSTDEYTPVAEKTQKLSQLNDLSKTTGGRKDILTTIYGNPGSSQYDQFLLDNTAPAKQKVTTALSGINPALEKTNSQITQLDSQIGDVKANNKQVADKTRQQFSTAEAGIRDNVNTAVTAKNTESGANQKAVKDELSSINSLITAGNFNNIQISDGTLKSIGMTREEWDKNMSMARDNFYGNQFSTGNKSAEQLDRENNLNIQNFLTQQPGMLQTGDVGTPEEQAKYRAYQQLIGDPDDAFFKKGATAQNNFDVKNFTEELTARFHPQVTGDGGSLTDLQTQAGLSKGNENNARNARVLAATASGAASGAEAGSVVPVIGTTIGAIVGAAIGFVSSGGIKAEIGNQGIGGGTIDQAREHNDYGRLAANPAATLASIAGVNSNSVLGKGLDPINTLFGNNDTQGTTDYKGYYKAGADDIAGRQLNDNQIGGIFYNTIKQNSGTEFVQNLAKAFDITGNVRKDDGNIPLQNAVKGFIDQKLQEMIKSGRLPSDPTKLSQINGSQIFNNTILNDLNKFIESKTGKANTIIADKGPGEKLLADITDNLIANKYGKKV